MCMRACVCVCVCVRGCMGGCGCVGVFSCFTIVYYVHSMHHCPIAIHNVPCHDNIIREG